MIMGIQDLETYAFVKANADLFRDMQDKYKYTVTKSTKIYTILNYKRILNDMADYLEGYEDYYKSDDDKYKSKVISSTAKFYDSIFTDKKYRRDVILADIPEISEEFLEGTKELQDVMKKFTAREGEIYSMAVLTNNQYRKLSKVFKDDIAIWKMLKNYPGYTPSSDIKDKFYDRNTPCMHEKKKE